uniref:Uncharacterized protein n=1 Tax=Oryza meridionalis TaxID=40149 RepID=A0A0E0EQY5_9ORYZ
MITYLTQQLHLPLVVASNLLTSPARLIPSPATSGPSLIAGVLSQLGMLGLVVSRSSLRSAPCSAASAAAATP